MIDTSDDQGVWIDIALGEFGMCQVHDGGRAVLTDKCEGFWFVVTLQVA